MSSDIYVTLMSNSCLTQFPNNTPQKFRNKLCTPINLDGDWQVALEDLSFPFKCFNIIQSIKVEFRAPCFQSKVHDEDNFHSPRASVESTPIESTPIESTPELDPPAVIESVFKSGLLEKGYYRDADELGSAIMSLFHDLYKEQRASGDLILDLDYDYSEVDNKFKFVVIELMEVTTLEDQDITIIASDWTPFLSHLGLESVISEDEIQLNPTAQMIPVTCNVPIFRRLYVCSDVIEYQQVAGTYTQLLATTPIDHSGRVECKIVPRFLSVRGTMIESIEIELMSNIQTRAIFPIPNKPSDYDYVECTLHFRRKSMLQSCI